MIDGATAGGGNGHGYLMGWQVDGATIYRTCKGGLPPASALAKLALRK
ncbi:hypothetical protein APV28_2126 [Comamonas testosteroni]|nr:hypothetical protein APV28_2126 [Comamonas testosteroni]